MHRRFLLLLALLVGCSRTSSTPVAMEPGTTGSAPKKIVLRGSQGAPAQLAPAPASVPSNQSSMVPPAPSALSASATPGTKAKVFEGAYVEDRGPCNGRAIAGFIGSGANRRPICGAETKTYGYGSRYGSPYGYGNGYNGYNNGYGYTSSPRRSYSYRY